MGNGSNSKDPAATSPAPTDDTCGDSGTTLSLHKVVQGLRSALFEVSKVEIKSDDKELQTLLQDILELKEFTLNLASGDTSKQLQVKGRTAGALKALQAHLQHMTWQTKQVAAGDFDQRMDFMGDFSEAFNSMTLQLKESRAKLQASEQKYRELAFVDPLTGIFNRRHFFELANKEILRAERQCDPIAILMIDADNFKRINDIHGHSAGDEVLCALSRLINSSIRGEDTLARYGGEEFIVVCPNSTESAALQVAERLRTSIEQTEIPFEDCTLRMTVSVGISVYIGSGCKTRKEDSPLEKVIDQADSALYDAKKGGRNKVCVFNNTP